MVENWFFVIFAETLIKHNDMKKLFVIVFALFSIHSFAQTFKNDGKQYEVYCDVKFFVNAFSKTSIDIIINDNSYLIKDEDGKEIKTKEVTKILNLLSKRGWKLVESFGTTGGGNLLPYERHYTMMKLVYNDTEIEEGIEPEK